jgi:hypothetical protein
VSISACAVLFRHRAIILGPTRPMHPLMRFQSDGAIVVHSSKVYNLGVKDALWRWGYAT